MVLAGGKRRFLCTRSGGLGIQEIRDLCPILADMRSNLHECFCFGEALVVVYMHTVYVCIYIHNIHIYIHMYTHVEDIHVFT